MIKTLFSENLIVIILSNYISFILVRLYKATFNSIILPLVELAIQRFSIDKSRIMVQELPIVLKI